MESVIHTSTAVYELAGTKRAASPNLLCVSSSTPELHQPLPRHGHRFPAGHACSCKRRRISQQPPLKTQNPILAVSRSPSSIIRYDFLDRVIEKAGNLPQNEIRYGMEFSLEQLQELCAIDFSKGWASSYRQPSQAKKARSGPASQSKRTRFTPEEDARLVNLKEKEHWSKLKCRVRS